MTRLHLGTAAAAALLVAASSAAAEPAISYVPGSLKQSIINLGPWTLHESGDNFSHDASGIVPAKGSKPPFTAFGTPYKGLCTADGQFAINHTKSLMQPY